MKPTRALLAVLLLAVSATAARAQATEDPLEVRGAWRWRRQIEFARMLANRQWFDLADEVIALLEAKIDIIGREKASLHRDLGRYFEEAAPARVRKEGMEGFIEYVGKARAYYQKTIDYLGKRGADKYAAEIADLLGRQSWLGMSVAEAHARFLSDPQATDAVKAKHKAAAVKIYQSTITDFGKAGVDKKRHAELVEKRKPDPKNKKLYAEWDRQYKEARSDHFRARLYYNEARLRYAQFLRDSKSKGWPEPLKAAETDLYKLLLEFSGTPGGKQANINYAIVLAEQRDAKKEKTALARFGDVWRGRDGFAQRRLPCQAALWMGKVQFRQKKLDEAIKQLHELLQFRSGGGWKPENPILTKTITDFLLDNEDADVEDFDQKGLAEAFLLFADAYAGKGKAAEAAKKPPREIRRLYGIAYDVASGVRSVRQGVGAARIVTVEQWRVKAKRPRSLDDLYARFRRALDTARNSKDPAAGKAAYLQAAQYLRQIVCMKAVPAETKREQWLLVAQCYYFGERYLEAYTAWTAYSRWYPKPMAAQREAAKHAISAASKHAGIAKNDFATKLVAEAQRHSEMLEGPGIVMIRYGIELRGEKKFKDAIEQFKQIKPDNEHYPRALYEMGMTYRAEYTTLNADSRAGPRGKALRAKLAEAFEKTLAEYAAKAPKLRASEDEADADKLKQLTEIAGATLLQYCNAHMQGLHPKVDLNEIITRTNDLAKDYPGVETSSSAPILYFLRLRAAYAQFEKMAALDEKELKRVTDIIESTWTTLKTFPDFKYISHACSTCANFRLKVAKKIQEAAGKTPSPAALEKISANESRALELYLELLTIAPAQPLNTYRYIIGRLKARGGDADYRAIVTVGATCLETYDMSKTPRTQQHNLRLIQTDYGIALGRTGAYAKSKPVLEEIDNVSEAAYQDRLGSWKKRNAAHRQDDRRNPAPGLKPIRRSEHRRVREWLARAYLETHDKANYAKAEGIYNDLGFALRRGRDAPTRKKYIEAIYRLIRTLLLQGNLEAGLGHLVRGLESYGDIIKSSTEIRRFRTLVNGYRKAAAGKKELLGIINDILKQLS
ncbi:hypothetical protein HQ560_21910 [bacterium]|nr:hypothetical protein [bacterium]